MTTITDILQLIADIKEGEQKQKNLKEKLLDAVEQIKQDQLKEENKPDDEVLQGLFAKMGLV